MLIPQELSDFNSLQVDILKNFTNSILSECKKQFGPHVRIDELSWIIKTQKEINSYLRIFNEQFNSHVLSEVDIHQLGRKQFYLLTSREDEIPNEGKITKEFFYPKLVETFAKHNKILTEQLFGS